MNKKTYRNCPICKENFAKVIYNQKFFISKESKLPNNYDVVCCNKCGFVYADTFATQQDYDLYYEQLSKYESEETSSGGGFSEKDRKRLVDTANLINNTLKNKDLRIIDIGCANGGLLEELKRLGYENVFGIDPSIKCVENVLKKNIKCEKGDIFKLPQKEKFDCVILSHVLEHIRNLAEIIIEIKKILAYIL